MGNQQFQYGRFVDEKKQGETRVVRNSLLPVDAPLLSHFKGMYNLKQIIEHNVRYFPDKEFTGTRKKTITDDGVTQLGDYEWTTWKQFYTTSMSIANYYQFHGLCPKMTFDEGDLRFMGIYSKNRQEWLLTDFACIFTGTTSVTLYDTLDDESIVYILNQTKLTTITCSSDKIQKLLDLKLNSEIKYLHNIIYYDDINKDIQEKANELNIQLIKFLDVISEGSKLTQQEFDEVTENTIYTFSYTSGTTGQPKGVMISHQGFVSNAAAMYQYDGQFEFTNEDVYISFLPLAHSFERYFMVCCICYQMRYGFYSGDTLKLSDDLQLLKPTIMATVPRLFNRYYDIIQSKIKAMTGYKRRLAEWGVEKKLANLRSTGKYSNTFYDTAIFNEFREIIGGRVRFMIIGSAPISVEVLDFMRIAFGAQVSEGYGQTECCAPCVLTWCYERQSGHVGGPLKNAEVKLIDAQELGYTTQDKDENGNPRPRGEVCYRGYSQFKGYFGQPEKTKETIDDEGWVHSGDIGMLLPNGAIKIIDRKKNIFKLSQGEYVIAEKIETHLVKLAMIAQVFVYGDSLQHYLVAIVVPDRPHIEQWASENQVSGEYSEILEDKNTNDYVLGEIKKKCREVKLNGFEIPQRIYLSNEPFTAENDILTPTFKLKRNIAKIYFLKQIKEMYNGAKLQGEKEVKFNL